MKSVKFLLIFAGASFLLHAIVFLFVTPHIRSRQSPLLYGWPEIIYKDNLFGLKDKVILPPEAGFSLDRVRSDYFSLPVMLPDQKSDISDAAEADNIPAYLSESKNHLLEKSTPPFYYLWEMSPSRIPREAEKVSYQILVSPHGKVLLSIPRRLTASSSGGLDYQEYIHKAGIFLNDKFFWTKIDGVVQ